MGVDGLLPYVKKTYPHVVETATLEKFKGQTLAVDSSIMAHLANYGIAENCLNDDRTVDEVKFYNLWIERCFSLLHDFIKAGITPIYVFDGKPPEAKDNTLKERKAERVKEQAKIDELSQKLDQALNLGDISTTTNTRLELNGRIGKNYRFSHQMMSRWKKDLFTLGVPIWQAISEADQLMSSMFHEGIVSGIVSTDSDMLLHGCSMIKLCNEYKDEIRVCEIIHRDIILKELNLTEEQFLNWGIRCGTDYNKRTPLIGPVKSLKQIRANLQFDSEFNGVSVALIKDLFSKKPSKELIFMESTTELNVEMFTEQLPIIITNPRQQHKVSSLLESISIFGD